jgi:hypothetical protein
MITAYRKKATVRPDGRIEIKTPSLKPGTRTEVIVLVENKPEKSQAQAKEWKALFKKTQSMPQAKQISEEEIAAEIAAYRAQQDA